MNEKNLVGVQPMEEDKNSLLKIGSQPYDPNYKNPTELEQIERLKFLSKKENNYFFNKGKITYRVDFFFKGCDFALGIVQHTYPNFTIKACSKRNAIAKGKNLINKLFSDKSELKFLYATDLTPKPEAPEVPFEDWSKIIIPICKNTKGYMRMPVLKTQKEIDNEKANLT